MVEINIENIIASATMSNGLDLEMIVNTLPNCEYNPGNNTEADDRHGN